MSEMTFDRIYGLALVAFALLVWYLFHRADDEVEASVARALGPVVPLEDLMHEQASAEAYDDQPDMDVEAGITYGPREVFGPLPKREPGATLDEFAGEQPGDDTIAALHDMTPEQFRAKLREQQIAVSAAVAAQRLDVEIFDLLHDAEGSR